MATIVSVSSNKSKKSARTFSRYRANWKCNYEKFVTYHMNFLSFATLTLSHSNVYTILDFEITHILWIYVTKYVNLHTRVMKISHRKLRVVIIFRREQIACDVMQNKWASGRIDNRFVVIDFCRCIFKVELLERLKLFHCVRQCLQ